MEGQPPSPGENDRAEERLTGGLEQAERMESLARLSAGLAHDFNNLLSVIVNFTQFAAEELDRDPEAARADLAEVAQAAARASELTRKLSVFARRDSAEPAAGDLGEALAGVRDGLAARAAERGIVLVAEDLGALSLPVTLEKGRLAQLIDHLVDNAFDALSEGGRLELAAESLSLPGPASPEAPADLPAGAYARLRVADDGVGAPPAVQARMFEPFFTTRRRGVGSGLGLAVVHGLVGRAGGSITVRSAEGQGTTVDVWLPLTGEAPAPPEPAAAAPRGHGQRLLVVDDDLPVLEAARRILAGAGYDVTATTDPLEALGLVQAGGDPFRGLVTDVVMPTLSGPELADAARRASPGLAVLFVSGYAAGLLGPAEWLPPGVRMLRKPFTDAELLTRVSESLLGA